MNIEYTEEIAKVKRRPATEESNDQNQNNPAYRVKIAQVRRKTDLVTFWSREPFARDEVFLLPIFSRALAAFAELMLIKMMRE